MVRTEIPSSRYSPLVGVSKMCIRDRHMTQFEKLDLLLRECGGTIQTFQVLNNGISKSVFYALHRLLLKRQAFPA